MGGLARSILLTHITGSYFKRLRVFCRRMHSMHVFIKAQGKLPSKYSEVEGCLQGSSSIQSSGSCRTVLTMHSVYHREPTDHVTYAGIIP